MTVLFRRTFTRPNAGVPFYEDPVEFTQYITDTYINTGKCLTWRDAVEGPTTRVTESTWATQEDIDEALVDSQILANSDDTRTHCDSNSITISTLIE